MYDYSVYECYLELVSLFPEIGGLDPLPVMELSMHTLVNGIVEVAGDGQSARTSYVTPGILYDCINNMCVKRCMSFWERYGSDFILEDGHWKYLHEHVCPDFGMPLDAANAAAGEYAMAVDPRDRMPPPPPAGRDCESRRCRRRPCHGRRDHRLLAGILQQL